MTLVKLIFEDEFESRDQKMKEEGKDD